MFTRNIFFIFVAPLILISFPCCSDSTSSNTKNDFSIFLTKKIENNSPEFVSLDSLVLEEEPFLSIEMIDTYEWEKHMITYPNSTKEKLKAKEPLFGRYFVVIAQKQRIYWGLITDDASSMSCQNPVIRIWSRHPSVQSFIPDTLKIDRAYPQYFGNINEKDLRDDDRIYIALKTSGKLR